jgi:hypothetical protein
MVYYIQTAVHDEDGVVSVLPIPFAVSQVDAIEVSEKTFINFEGEARTLRLYRVDQESGEIVHVQTWTKDPAVAERF